MCRKVINVCHHLSSGCCMWSGIEDVYGTKTNQNVPEAFLFGLSSYGEATLLMMNDTKQPFLFSVADGRTKKIYDQIKEVLGLRYQISEGRTLSYALSSIKKEIDEGNPVILGPLDMYHLPYLKMYHKMHIPMHYVLMVGYDERKDCVLIYDCDRIELIELPKQELIKAWAIEKNVVGDNNGFIRFTLCENPKELYQLAYICLKKKAERQLREKPDFIGVNAYTKIAKELKKLESRYSKAELKEILASLTEFFGTVPKLPNALLGVSDEKDIHYHGNYDRLSAMLLELGKTYYRKDWIQASELFSKCGLYIEKITNCIIELCLVDKDCMKEISEYFVLIGESAKRAYEIIREEQ